MVTVGGAYTADRAAALSGVPKSTVYYWARNGHLAPSVSAEETMLWSFTDLLGLRVIYWLRQPKRKFDREIPKTSMPKVKHALRELSRLGVALVEGNVPVVAVTLDGDITIESRSLALQRVDGQQLHPEVINLVAAFQGLEGTRGPDLFRPRPTLRIVPRKLGGAPHIEDTRLPTLSIHALAKRGISIAHLANLYPFVSREAIQDGIDLEIQLERNLAARAA